ncbi:MAG: hypothetical protein KBB70_01885 [Candidatus Pacebacteria bacterium]|nr:hypothetical protein [Candidatus Paceibacterota bacterium]
MLSLSGFVVLCIAIGAISIIKQPITKAEGEQGELQLKELPIEMVMDVEEPTCIDDAGATIDCFPIITGVSESSQSAAIELAWRRSKYNKQSIRKPSTPTSPISSTPATIKPVTTTPTPPITPTTPVTPAIPVTPIIPTVPTTPTAPATPTTPAIPTTPVVTTPTPSPVTPTVVGEKQWGAFIPSGSPSDVTALEAIVGSPMDIRAVFVGWGNGASDFPSWLTSNLKSANKTLLMYWEPAANGDTGNTNQPGYNYDSITSGKWDTSITAFAKAVKTYGGPVILIPFDEMNGDWYPWSGTNNGNSPAKHNAAYKHLHNIFAAQGVTNVKWGWAPNNDSWPNVASNDLTLYYPGDAYVDYVGVDGFNFNNPWVTYNQIFDKAMSKLEQYNKPIFIFSMASGEAGDGGAKKAAWVTDTLTQIAKNPKIKGWIWFNENKERNWLLNSSTSVLNAFSTGIKAF